MSHYNFRNDRLALPARYGEPLHFQPPPPVVIMNNVVPVAQVAPVVRTSFFVRVIRHMSVAKLLKTGSCISAIMYLILAIQLGLSIASIILNDKYDADQATCMGNYGGILFGYQKWLLIFGWTGIGIVSAIVLGLLCSCAQEIRESMEGLVNSIAGLGYLFQVAWYVVGSILYFKTIHHDCPSGDVIRDYGLSVFIIETVVIGLLWLTKYQDSRYEMATV
jgi:hypothetical protein